LLVADSSTSDRRQINRVGRNIRSGRALDRSGENLNPHIYRGLKGSAHIMKNDLGSCATSKSSLQRGNSSAGRVFVASNPTTGHLIFQQSGHFNPNANATPRVDQPRLIELCFKRCNCAKGSQKMTLMLVNFCTASLGERCQGPHLSVISGSKQTSQFASREKTTKNWKMRFMPRLVNIR
jgi:hypothetical protein